MKASTTTLLGRYNCGPAKFVGAENALYERHLTFDHVVPLGAATSREKAASGKFSSDRTVAEYARDIWKVKSCQVDVEEDA